MRIFHFRWPTGSAADELGAHRWHAEPALLLDVLEAKIRSWDKGSDIITLKDHAVQLANQVSAASVDQEEQPD